MGDLFQDEPDEASPASPFGREHAEQSVLFMDEADEDVNSIQRRTERKSLSTGPVLHEPNERESQLFGDEPNESDDDDTDSDLEKVPDGDINQGSKSLVELSFSTISQFLSTQLARASASGTASSQPARKKRCYDNSKRAAAAEQRKAQSTTSVPVPKQQRNCPET